MEEEGAHDPVAEGRDDFEGEGASEDDAVGRATVRVGVGKGDAVVVGAKALFVGSAPVLVGASDGVPVFEGSEDRESCEEAVGAVAVAQSDVRGVAEAGAVNDELSEGEVLSDDKNEEEGAEEKEGAFSVRVAPRETEPRPSAAVPEEDTVRDGATEAVECKEEDAVGLGIGDVVTIQEEDCDPVPELSSEGAPVADVVASTEPLLPPLTLETAEGVGAKENVKRGDGEEEGDAPRAPVGDGAPLDEAQSEPAAEGEGVSLPEPQLVCVTPTVCDDDEEGLPDREADAEGVPVTLPRIVRVALPMPLPLRAPLFDAVTFIGVGVPLGERSALPVGAAAVGVGAPPDAEAQAEGERERRGDGDALVDAVEEALAQVDRDGGRERAPDAEDAAERVPVSIGVGV